MRTHIFASESNVSCGNAELLQNKQKFFKLMQSFSGNANILQENNFL